MGEIEVVNGWCLHHGGMFRIVDVSHVSPEHNVYGGATPVAYTSLRVNFRDGRTSTLFADSQAEALQIMREIASSTPTEEEVKQAESWLEEEANREVEDP